VKATSTVRKGPTTATAAVLDKSTVPIMILAYLAVLEPTRLTTSVQPARKDMSTIIMVRVRVGAAERVILPARMHCLASHVPREVRRLTITLQAFMNVPVAP
jgi:hypothetical protein